MIRDRLISALKTEFPSREIVLDSPPQPVVTFAAAQEAIGKVMVYDHGNEVTVNIGSLTHGHFTSTDLSLTEDEKIGAIIEDVIDFLRALFSDRVLLHAGLGRRTGGWERLDFRETPVALSPSCQYYLWSKPYSK